jgi:acyl-CoA thioester hydrolase
MGRAALMRDMGYPYKTIEDSGYVYPVIEIGAKFHHPLHYDDPMWIHTRPLEPERVKVRFDYVITHAESGETICTGFTAHCALNLDGKPAQVDKQTVKIIRSFPE